MILSYHDGPGIGASTLVRHPSGTGQGDVIARPDKGNGPGTRGWVDDVPRPQRVQYSQDLGTVSVNGQDWATTTSGAGSSATPTAVDATHQAVWQLASGTTTTGRSSRGLVVGTGWCVFNSGVMHRYWCRFMVPTLSDGTDSFGVVAGFHDVNTADDPVDGAYFRLTQADGGSVQAVTSSNSTRTVSTTGLTLVANTWYHGEIVVNGTSTVDFYIWAEGSVKPASPTVTISTNIPSGTTRGMGVRAGILKSAGTNSRTFNVQYQQPSFDRMAA